MDDESNEAEVDEVNEEATDQNSDEVIVFVRASYSSI